MARDVCADCERHFPFGEGLVDNLCDGCRKARAAMKEEAEDRAPEREQPQEEPFPRPTENNEPPPAERAEEEQ